MQTKETLKTNSTLERALAILTFLSVTEGKIGVRELAELMQLPKSTTHRILETLLDSGFVEQDAATEKYSIGLKAIEIGMSGLKKMDLVSASIPAMQELVADTKQTSFLAVYNEGEIVYIYKSEGTSSVITNANLGTRNPIYCTGLGKAMMAFFTPQEVENILKQKGLEKYTETTITEWDRFFNELEKIRENGIAFNFEEYDVGLSSIAAPIFNYTGQVIAALSVAGATSAIYEEQERIASLVKEKGCLISRRLGYVP